jgi:hypothetical protein
MNRQEVGVTSDDMSNNPDYIRSENKFQQIQEHMKIILKPMLLKKNPNANDQDIDKVCNSFFNLGAEKASEVKRMVDNSKDSKRTAQDIVNKYYKYVKINFGTKDNVNNVEQDSVMTSEGKKRVQGSLNGVCEYCDGTGRDPEGKGKCRFCKGTGLSKNKMHHVRSYRHRVNDPNKEWNDFTKNWNDGYFLMDPLGSIPMD